jgi:hypothetical protein
MRRVHDHDASGRPAKVIQGHNRRVVGSKGWREGPYWFIRINGCKIAEHRHVMEFTLGRRRGSNEVVHHGDHDPMNNDPSNLALLSRSEHQPLHACSSRKPWKAEESLRAVALRKAGMTIREIALVLGRPFTTAARLAKLTKESTGDPIPRG